MESGWCQAPARSDCFRLNGDKANFCIVTGILFCSRHFPPLIFCNLRSCNYCYKTQDKFISFRRRWTKSSAKFFATVMII